MPDSEVWALKTDSEMNTEPVHFCLIPQWFPPRVGPGGPHPRAPGTGCQVCPWAVLPPDRKRVCFTSYGAGSRVALGVNGWPLPYFLYFPMFEIFHHFEKGP